jgi:hypothetical protein
LQLTVPTPWSTVHVVAPVVAIVRTALDATPAVTAAEKVVIAVSAHTPGVPLQAQAPASTPAAPHAQSAVDVHPHTPPVTHAVPLAFPLQSVQAPLVPQAGPVFPGSHVLPSAAEQHPPLHVSPPAHDAEHVWFAAQAWFVGQSEDKLHATHVFVAVLHTGVPPTQAEWFVAVHATQVFVVVLHAGVGPEQFPSPKHWTQEAAEEPSPLQTPPAQGVPGVAVPHAPLAHVLHGALQAMLQHTLPTHSLVVHWSCAVHALPVAFFATHFPALGPVSAQ